MIHYVNKNNFNYPRSACNLAMSLKQKTNDIEKVTCRACLRSIEESKDVEFRRFSCFKREKTLTKNK